MEEAEEGRKEEEEGAKAGTGSVTVMTTIVEGRREGRTDGQQSWASLPACLSNRRLAAEAPYVEKVNVRRLLLTFWRETDLPKPELPQEP